MLKYDTFITINSGVTYRWAFNETLRDGTWFEGALDRAPDFQDALKDPYSFKEDFSISCKVIDLDGSITTTLMDNESTGTIDVVITDTETNTETSFVRNITVSRVSKTSIGFISLKIKSKDWEGLKIKYPGVVYTEENFPTLNFDDQGKQIPRIVGTSYKVPFVLFSSTLSEAEYNTIFADGAYEARSRYGAYEYIGPMLDDTEISTSGNEEQYVLAVYRSGRNVVQDTPKEFEVDTINISGDDYLRITFPRDQSDFSNGAEEITADIKSTIIDSKRTPSFEIKRLLELTGLTVDAVSFAAAIDQDEISDMYVDTIYLEDRTLRAIVTDYLPIARSFIYQKNDGTWAIQQDAEREIGDYVLTNHSPEVFLPLNDRATDVSVRELTGNWTNPTDLLDANAPTFGLADDTQDYYTNFVGTDDKYTVATADLPGNFSDIATAFTIFFTFRPTFINDGTLPHIWNMSNTTIFLTDISANPSDKKLQVEIAGATIAASIALTSDTWYSACVIFDSVADTLKIRYYDGTSIVDSNISSTTLVPTIADFTIGTSVASNTSKDIRDFGIVASALTDSDVDALITRLRSRSNTVAYLYEDLGDTLSIKEYSQEASPKTLVLNYGKEAEERGLKKQFSATNTRGDVEDSYEFSQIKEPATADRLHQYFYNKIFDKRTSSGVLYNYNIRPGNFIDINNTNLWSGTKKFKVIAAKYKDAAATLSLLEYTGTDYTYTATPGISPLVPFYKPDLSNTPPIAPTDLELQAAVAVNSNSTFNMTFRTTPPSDLNYDYLMFLVKSLDAPAGSIENIQGGQGIYDSVNNTYTFEAAGIPADKDYTVEAWAVNKNGIEGAVVTLVGTPIPWSGNVPLAPIVDSTTVIETGVNIDWHAGGGLIGFKNYNVYRKVTGSLDSTYVLVYEGTETEFDDTGLTLGIDYTWKLEQENINSIVGASTTTTIVYTGTKLDGIDAGADVTADNTAAAIAGQGALATENTADFDTQVGGAEKPSNNADVTKTIVEADLVIDSGGIEIQNGGSLRSTGVTNENMIASGGFFLGFNTTTYTFGVGTDTKYLKWDGTDLTIKGDLLFDANNYWKISDGTFKIGDGTSKLEWDGSALIVDTLKTSTSGQRIELNPSTDNELHFYGDRGDTTIEELATIGINTIGFDSVIFSTGSEDSSKMAIKARGNSVDVIQGLSYGGGAGVRGQILTTTGDSNTQGIHAAVTGTGGSGVSALYINNSVTTASGYHISMKKLSTYGAGAPTHNPGTRAGLIVNSVGDLYWNKGNTTTWTKIV